MIGSPRDSREKVTPPGKIKSTKKANLREEKFTEEKGKFAENRKEMLIQLLRSSGKKE